MPSPLRTIDGVVYDRSILETAAELVAGEGDGRISKKDAVELFIKAMDAGRLTKHEENSMAYIKKQFKFTGSGRSMLDFLVNTALERQAIKSDK